MRWALTITAAALVSGCTSLEVQVPLQGLSCTAETLNAKNTLVSRFGLSQAASPATPRFWPKHQDEHFTGVALRATGADKIADMRVTLESTKTWSPDVVKRLLERAADDNSVSSVRKALVSSEGTKSIDSSSDTAAAVSRLAKQAKSVLDTVQPAMGAKRDQLEVTLKGSTDKDAMTSLLLGVREDVLDAAVVAAIQSVEDGPEPWDSAVGAATPAERQDADQRKSTARFFVFLRAYMHAYFVRGDFLSLGAKKQPEPKKEGGAQGSGQEGAGAKASAPPPPKPAFVARNGTRYRFADVVLTFDESTGRLSAQGPKGKDVIPDLLTIMVEAAYDAMGDGLPAVHGATACAANGKGGQTLFTPAMCLAQDADESLLKTIAAADQRAVQSGAQAQAVTAMLARSGSILALNNEAVADAVATVMSSVARKTSERRAANDIRGCSPAS